jgi:exosortase E/protease (VPEID-CTERM system)
VSEDSVVGPALRKPRLGLPARLGLLGLLLLAEKFVLGSLVDDTRARAANGAGAFVHTAQHWGFRFLVTFLAAVSVLAYVRAQRPSRSNNSASALPEVRFRWILAHVLLVGALAPLSYALYRGDVGAGSFAWTAVIWIAVGAMAVAAAILGLAPWSIWLQGIRSLGIAWLYAAIAALFGICVWQQSQKLWGPAAGLTFELVKLVLTPILPIVSADPATHVIRASHFAVEVTEACSGLEGLGLMLAFSVAWLLYFRREYIFPRALLLIPVSLCAIFGLNVLRISVLMLIGNAGYPEIASYGFHSQAGWIAFNAVACTLVFVSRRSRWLFRSTYAPPQASQTYNPTASYLVPLLAILAAGVLSHAMSGRFETLYPLRLIAGASALWVYRREIAALEWKFSWRGPATGALVFLLWIGAAQALLQPSSMPQALAALSPEVRMTWILARVLAAVLTVPIAEELAYRGFLMRRLVHADFESIPYRSVGWPALLATAVVFGVGHGVLWLPGIAAGIAYGLLAVRGGQLGDAVAAHATTNALIALVILGGDQWQLW